MEKEEEEIIIEKSETQGKILNLSKEQNKSTEEEFNNILRIVAPGTRLRSGLNGIVNAKKGALIAVENEILKEIIDGGFKVKTRFTPQKLVELSKMDGAMVLSNDMKKIKQANALLIPDPKIKTSETGTRHKAAERTARQTGTLVIAVSERKNEITIYYKNKRYTLIDTSELLRKVNESIQILEKQRELFDKHIENLDKIELRNYESLNQAINAIQKGILIQKISKNIQKYLLELGNEGALFRTRVKEIMQGVERETDLVIKDYTKVDVKKSKNLLSSLKYDEVLEEYNILRALAYENNSFQGTIKGWRILNKTSLESQDIALIIKEARTLGKAINSNIGFYKELLGEERAKIFKEEVERIKLHH